ncbi:hypothetical protein [Paenibacillus sp. QZ-Y1]|uniref:hypothetical protein n=1 Tax=Paenibacillus sp. QZ-Y1 TaxID=3414511 RepID=UPI003F78C2AA
MRQEDSLFEQIMKLKRATLVQRKAKTKELRNKPQGKLSDLEIQYKSLIAESVDRETPLERVIQIKKELTELRRHKKGRR